MNPMFEKVAGSLARALLKSAAGALITYGVLTQDNSAAFIEGGAVLAIGVAWSLYEKYTSRQKLVTAMAQPAAVSETQVKAIIAAGDAVSVKIPKDIAPQTAPEHRKDAVTGGY